MTTRVGQFNTVQSVFFTAVFSIMGHMARLNGRISEAHIQAAKGVMNRLGLRHELKQEAICLFNLGKQARFNLSTMLQQLVHHCGAHDKLCRIFIDIQIHIAYADGHVHLLERQILLHMAGKLGLSSREFAQAEARYRAYARSKGERNDYTKKKYLPQEQLNDAYQLLGVVASASDKEVEIAYRRLLSQYHPDRLMAKGLPDDLLQVATDKTCQIKSAFALIKAARNQASE